MGFEGQVWNPLMQYPISVYFLSNFNLISESLFPIVLELIVDYLEESSEALDSLLYDIEVHDFPWSFGSSITEFDHDNHLILQIFCFNGILGGYYFF